MNIENNEPIAENPIEEWISSVVHNQTFADVGGIGVNSVNERIGIVQKVRLYDVTDTIWISK